MKKLHLHKHRNPAEFPFGKFDVFNYIMMAILAFISLFPLYYVVIISLAPQESIQKHSLYILPYSISTMAYHYIFKDHVIFHSFLISVFVTVVATVLGVLFCTAGGYVLTKKNLPGRKLLFAFITIPMFFGGGLVPSFLNIQSLGMYNNLLALILPNLAGAFNLIIMKSFLDDLPAAVEESAKIDGANELVILYRIVLPMSLPVVATIALFYAVGYWNDYFSAYIYINDDNLKPLQTILYEMLADFQTMMANQAGAAIRTDNAKVYSLSLQMATVVLSTVPILCVYPFIQKYFTKGLKLGAVKE